MRIAVIDNGIHTESAVYAKTLDFDMECIQGVIRRRESPVLPASHGTIVADLIQAYAPEAEIGSIQIMKQKERGDVRDVVCAAKWCAGHGVDVIHMSIGTVQWQDFAILERGLMPLAGKVPMMAAGNNEGSFALPCGLPGVWEARYVKDAARQGAWQKENGAWLIVTDLQIPERLRMQYGNNTGHSNSYQAAAVTGCMVKEKAFSRKLTQADMHEIIKTYSGCGLVPSGRKPKAQRSLLSETPVVWIQAQPVEKEGVYHLLEEFHRNDYYAILVADWEDTGFDTLFWQRREKLTEDALQEAAGEYGCDLLFAVSTQPDVRAVADFSLKITGRMLLLYETGEVQPRAELKKSAGWHMEMAALLCRCYGREG